MDYQASPLTLAGPTSFASPTLGYTYAHSHLNVSTQPTYGYTYEHVDSDGYPLGASSTANEYSLDYSAVTSTVDTIGSVIPSATPSTSSSSLAAALTFPYISAAPVEEADHSMVIEHEVSQTLFSKWWRTNLIGSDTQHDTVYDGESSYGYDAYGYQYDDEPAHVGGDIDTHPTFEEGSAPSYTMYLQAPASSDVVHAAAQVLAPAPREREVDPQARVPEVVTAASPWMDHLPYQPRYTMNSASKDIADLDAAATTSHPSAPTTGAAISSVPMDRHGASGPPALDLPTSPSAFGMKREDTTESTPAVFHIKHEDDDADDDAETASAMMSALTTVSPIAMSAPFASTSTSASTGSHTHATSTDFISKFAVIQPFALASGSRIKIDEASDDDDDDDEYVMPGKGKGRARAASKGKAVSKGKGKAYTKPSEAESSHRDRERERQRKKSAAKAAVMRQFQACAGSHAAMHDEDEESQASGSGSGAQTQDTKKKQPFLACFFCRGRKIACGPPPPGSADRTCK